MLVKGPRRVVYLALGGGAIVMVLVGLAIPGVPTVTFAMLSGYYLARSSIRLHGRLVRSRFFGPIIREWSLHHGLSAASKAKLFVVTMSVVGLSFVLVGITPLVLSVTFVLSTTGVVSLLRLPGPEERIGSPWPLLRCPGFPRPPFDRSGHGFTLRPAIPSSHDAGGAHGSPCTRLASLARATSKELIGLSAKVAKPQSGLSRTRSAPNSAMARSALVTISSGASTRATSG